VVDAGGRGSAGRPGSRPIIIDLRAAGPRRRGVRRRERFPLNRFFLGGTQFGQPCAATTSRRSRRSATSIGSADPSAMRLGDAFFVVTGEYASGSTTTSRSRLFADAGNIWNDPAAINPSRLYRSVGLGATS
jgi:hypothetical protein